MIKTLTATALAAAFVFGSASVAEARCYGFRGKDFKVCVEGNNGSARRQATEVCEEVSGGSCSISGDSGECRRSSSQRCYDANGDEQSHIDPD